ncbi:MAG: hypothetical protein QOF08_1014, partial [Gaiellales bacterium]|nr:hypothetical protein [Gaiellales bacterium]
MGITAGHRVTAIALTAALAGAGWACWAARAEAYVYWAASSTIGRANLDGTGVNANFVTGLNGTQ